MSLNEDEQKRARHPREAFVGEETGNKNRTVPNRSRGWTPLKYPKSAILPTGTNLKGSSFPLHNDVLLAAVRELLILDGVLDAKTLGTQLHKDSPSATVRSKQAVKRGRKRLRDENGNLNCHPSAPRAPKSPAATKGRVYFKSGHQKPSAEAIAQSILENSSLCDGEPSIEVSTLVLPEAETKDLVSLGNEFGRRPRTVSEADQSPASCLPASFTQNHRSTASAAGIAESNQMSQIFDLKRKDQHGRIDFQLPLERTEPVPDLFHVSIADEEILREAAMERTQRLVKSLTDRAIRSFFGYKISGIDRERLVHVLAGLLFDVSHAMYAWEQTEKDIFSSRVNSGGTDRRQELSVEGVDGLVLESLFDGSERAMKRIGGFDPWGLLPNAISIGRLRRQRTSWTFFATTVRGIRMLEHHKCEKSRMLVGKQRRGHRTRQPCRFTRESTTRTANELENLPLMASSLVPISSSVSVASDDEIKDVVVSNSSSFVGIPANPTFTSLLARMPGCLALSITRPDGNTSWGVGLLKEGDVCVVGRVGNESSLASNDTEDSLLLCGDLILFAQSENGKYAWSPLCTTPYCASTDRDDVDFGNHEDWYRSLVNLFKTSQEMHLLIQRVT